jgi:DMSO/TMAO reductase YedYZ heme-binding membrane subunit
MIVIVFVILLSLVAVYHNKFIRKHNLKIYIGATLLSILIFLVRDKMPLSEPFVQGYLGLAFLYIVMITGILKNKSKLKTSFMSIRREYSIIGFIFLTPHALKYLFEYLHGEVRFEWFGVIPFAIMIPLFITSFMVIRKKFTYATWKRIQRYAYIAYILTFIHLLLVSEMPSLLVYLVLFAPYIIMKPIIEYKKIVLKNSKQKPVRSAS